jgi:hypothetical protein
MVPAGGVGTAGDGCLADASREGHGMIDAVDCPFCLPLVEPHIVLADEHCYAMWTRETPEGSAMVLPHAHRPTVFALTQDESLATRQLLEQMKII